MDIAAFGALSSALSSLRTIIDIAKSVNNQQLNSAVLDVQEKLIDVQQRLVEANEENATLKEENRQLKSAVELEKHVVFHDHANWKKADDGTEEGPFCPGCWTEGKLYRAPINCVERGVVEFICDRHKGPYLFPVPERLVNHGDLSSYKSSGVSYGGESSGGTDSWMRR